MPTNSSASHSNFSRAEWELLKRLPGRVVIAAIVAERDSDRHTVAEGVAGLDAIAAGRSSASGVVRGVVNSLYAEAEPEAPPPERFGEGASVAAVLSDCATAAQVLADRSGPDDLDAYGEWLASIGSRVCRTARFVGAEPIGEDVSPNEAHLLSGLAHAFAR